MICFLIFYPTFAPTGHVWDASKTEVEVDISDAKRLLQSMWLSDKVNRE